MLTKRLEVKKNVVVHLRASDRFAFYSSVGCVIIARILYLATSCYLMGATVSKLSSSKSLTQGVHILKVVGFYTLCRICSVDT